MLKATFTVFMPSGLLTCSNAMLPLRLWPAMPRFTFNPSTRTYGPAWTFTLTVSPPTMNDSFTAAFVLLMDTESVPVRVTLGMLTLMVPLNWPAIPALVRMNAP